MDRQILIPGTKVTVKVRDWNPNASTVFTLTGTIHSKVTSPAGYNVRLDKPHTFIGHVPLPFSDQVRIDTGDQTITLNLIFVRAFDIFQEPEYDMRFADKMSEFCTKLLFPTVSAVLPQDNKLKISHVLYYHPNGEIKTLADPSPTRRRGSQEEIINQARIVVKYEHFFGFATKSPQQPDDSLYFSSNRYAHINFLRGLKWTDIKPNPPKPKNGDTLCCSVSGKYNGSSESMDYWFIASQQLQLLVKLCTGVVKIPLNEAIENLIIPENEAKMPILTEVPESRYVYAGIWLLMNKKHIPEYYNLPKRRIPGSLHVTDVEPFEVWWTRDILSKSE
jgi:hypothetical protein